MTSTCRRTGRGGAPSPGHLLDEVESVARIGSYSLDIPSGHWVSTKGLDAIFGIDAAFERSMEGWASLVHPNDRAGMLAYFAEDVIGRGLPFDRRYRIVRPDSGEERWVDGRGALELDERGAPLRMLGTIADVTEQVVVEEERARLEEGLGRSERNLAEAQRIAHIGSWERDLATGALHWSAESHRMFGIESGTFAGTQEAFLAFVHPDDRVRASPTLADLAAADSRTIEYRIVRPDGAVRHLHEEAEVIRDPTGVAVRYVGSTQDITERVAAEAERARLTAAIEQTSDSVVITDLTGSIEYANPAFEAVSGYRRDEVIGQNPRILQSGRQSAAFYRALWRRLTRGESWAGRFINLRADGAPYEVEATISPIRDPGGEITGYIAVERDVTALQAARSSLAHEFRERAQVAAALGRLQPARTAAETAALICDELAGLPGVDLAAIFTFHDPEHATTLAWAGPERAPLAPGRPLPAARATYLYERAAQGPWAETWRTRPEDGQYGRQIAEVGLRASAFAPIRNGEGLLGLVAVGTTGEGYARHLIDHLPVVGEFAATASALLARDLEGDRRRSTRHAEITGIIAGHAFHPVFQPIVALDGGEIVGYEALTRFSDGTRPDLRLAEAWTVDLGADLELATLDAAITLARELPAARWLNVNVSPRLLADPERVRTVLAMVDRPLIVEITEHDTVADYRALREAIGRLGDSVRTAVDDAGAGIANFAHIVELRPDFVKLDIGLVRGVNADLGRQAMVVGMRHFARTAGCRLIAEGEETD
ncbi:MAG TPA: PAS domain-containing protein, partial [Candidatus Saccharimonadales bacterium]|nr:PAS domain-containing protein [Candidatus Saccharimonadales bacterium]